MGPSRGSSFATSSFEMHVGVRTESHRLCTTTLFEARYLPLEPLMLAVIVQSVSLAALIPAQLPWSDPEPSVELVQMLLFGTLVRGASMIATLVWLAGWFARPWESAGNLVAAFTLGLGAFCAADVGLVCGTGAVVTIAVELFALVVVAKLAVLQRDDLVTLPNRRDHLLMFGACALSVAGHSPVFDELHGGGLTASLTGVVLALWAFSRRARAWKLAAGAISRRSREAFCVDASRADYWRGTPRVGEAKLAIVAGDETPRGYREQAWTCEPALVLFEDRGALLRVWRSNVTRAALVLAFTIAAALLSLA